jgi:hypothetical protein
MAEVRIEIATEQPKILTADAVKASDVVIIASRWHPRGNSKVRPLD